MSALGRPIVRKYAGPVPTDMLDIAALASIDVTSEQELYPIDNVFDGRSGPGGSCWIAAEPGAQIVVLRFHRAQDVRLVIVESEERGDTRTQRIDVAGWNEDTQRPFDAPPRVFRYTPYGPSFHRATWDIDERAVTHLRFRVAPLPADRRASITAIIIR